MPFTAAERSHSIIETPVGKPGDRQKRIELVARICFGHDPADPSQPIPGWQARLSKAMGMGRTAVHDTLKRGESKVFDRKLRAFVVGRRIEMAKEMQALETIEQILGANEDLNILYRDAWKDDE